jgi:T4 bacteriophage base plate protein
MSKRQNQVSLALPSQRNMQSLSNQQLLSIWERGLGQTLTQRAIALLLATAPELSEQDAVGLSIGQRDTQLMTLREWTFGSQLFSVTNCPACAERLELKFDLDDIRLPTSQVTQPITLNCAGYKVEFRLPNSADVSSLTNADDAKQSEAKLLQRCILSATRKRKPESLEQLPERIQTAIITQMNEADPQANIKLGLNCAACQHQWLMTFDIVSFFWGEINAWAQRLLREVHLLARAYSWRESDILSMTALRRQFYLEMLGV